MTRAEYIVALNEAIARGDAPAFREANPPPSVELVVPEAITFDKDLQVVDADLPSKRRGRS